MTEELDLIQIVTTSVLQELPDAYYEATGLATGIHDLNGELITSIPKYCFTKFCRNMFFSKEGHRKCRQCNSKADKKAFELGGPYIYHCHAGLIDVAAPIIVGGYHVGTVACGQILLQQLNDPYRERVRRKLSDFPSRFIETQMEALEEVPVIPLKRVRGFARLLWAVANNVVYLINNNIKEKRLNIENIKLISEIKARLQLEKDIHAAKLQVKEAELKSLQAQINPHFLYNTLDSIQWLAVLHGADDIQRMIQNLSQVLHHSLDRKNLITSVRDELEQIRSYLMIQRTRYGDKISYFINVEPDVLDFRLPKLVLQPLVENAILHGLEPKSSPGKVWINGWLSTPEEAVIEVGDDGVGIDSDHEDLLISQMTSAPATLDQDSLSHHRLGLLNVHRRLIQSFGERCGLRIEGNGSGGTIVNFRIPRPIPNQDAPT
ncbi:MAG: PocR ligand-binding domain-containing protein [Spirochaetaceae bacterium]|nr:MAG: PocR ligand-binding domain-containing protein [Spirochaetaceae bacterium]